MARVTVVRAEGPVTLEMSHEEAQALANVLGALTSACERHVGNRGVVDTYPIYDKLVEAGYAPAVLGVILRPRYD